MGYQLQGTNTATRKQDYKGGKKQGKLPCCRGRTKLIQVAVMASPTRRNGKGPLRESTSMFVRLYIGT